MGAAWLLRSQARSLPVFYASFALAFLGLPGPVLSVPRALGAALRDVPAEDPESGVLPLVEGHVITVLSKAAGEVFDAVVDGKFTIVDVVIPEGWYAGSDNDAFGPVSYTHLTLPTILLV